MSRVSVSKKVNQIINDRYVDRKQTRKKLTNVNTYREHGVAVNIIIINNNRIRLHFCRGITP